MTLIFIESNYSTQQDLRVISPWKIEENNETKMERSIMNLDVVIPCE